jgi:phospholipid-binding lipoprotein MlaA
MVAALCAVVGCTAPRVADPMRPAEEQEQDPWQGFNRKIFWFNDKVDVYVLEPVATGWDKVLPDPVQHSISHFFENLRFPVILINDLLQLKPGASGIDVVRFGVNTSIGVLGFMDPATSFGLEKHDEDFGQTLGKWGVPPGPYLVLPIFGPSNVRDTVGRGADYALAVTPWFVDQIYLIPAQVIDTVNTRSLFLDEMRNARESSLDFYVFVRNAYAQRRVALIADQKPEEAAPNQEELYYPRGLEPVP